MKDFLESYLTAAIRVSTDDEGNHCHDGLSIADFSKESFERAKGDCEKFLSGNEIPEYPNPLGGYSNEQMAGNDFWLTRNSHGSGFWNRNLPEDVSKKLTNASHAFGNCYIDINEKGELTLS